MSETDVLLLNMEVEAAAARNADLSRRLERITEELGCSSVHVVEKPEMVSQGTQTEFDTSRDAALNLDDLLFEIAEITFRLYPSSPIDLSSRRGDGPRHLEELSHRCLDEMRSLRAALETKLEGYNKFIQELQQALGTYYRSIEKVETQLREKELECDALQKQNTELLRQCAGMEAKLKVAYETRERFSENATCQMHRVRDLEAERDRLLKRETVLANTVASLRAECALGPWKNTTLLRDSSFETASPSPHVLPGKGSVSPVRDAFDGASFAPSTLDVMWACQGSAINRAFPEWCVSAEKVVDFSCKMGNT
ncbi:hypothetical protein TraAM80_05430 [Trypanosoma rangeli]|uniref:Uncharacterized protein n=1 Tax=Trypanosoma rangeli TaxID=5698 RepID=A0A422NF37_TRYRA|nr:uncharacterized protein TraAM80_05430 [Trypanosoma rangeli]RNF04078.1 hypothetical protein TraAM80_05430 [Trypanosoma rangeli]|eukprot:RNF04078.1 hypothetical protein TraAM80_05430 [Trypanosoma rangeli]